MKKTFILLAAVTLAAVFTLNCCAPCSPEKMTERMIEKGLEKEGGGDVDINISGRAPKDLPKELIYPGAKVVGSFSGLGDEGATGGIASLETRASVSTVSKYYEGLASKGWSNEGGFSGSGEDGESFIITLTKGDFSAVVTVSEEDGKTVIALMYGSEKK